MEFETTIVLIIGLVFVSLVAMKVFFVWSSTNAGMLRHQFNTEHELIITQVKRDNEVLERAVHNWKYKYHKIVQGYDVEPGEDEYLDEDAGEEDQLSDLVKMVWTKMPKSISKIIDEPGLQEAIVKGATRNPKALEGLIAKFTKPDETKQSDQTKVQAPYTGI